MYFELLPNSSKQALFYKNIYMNINPNKVPLEVIIRVFEKCNVKRLKQWGKKCARDVFPYFCDLFIILVEGVAIEPVEESGNTNNFFLFVDDREGEHILNHPSSLIRWSFLSNESKRIVKLF